jgi:amidase
MEKVVIEDGFETLLSGMGLDLVAVPQDSKIPSMATASGECSSLLSTIPTRS